MGLDMYLTKKIYIGGNYEHNKVTGEIKINRMGEDIKINLNKIVYIEESAGYWRKANAIHNWFVNNIQEGIDDCKEYYVSPKKLKELYDICKKVKNTAKVAIGSIKNGQKLEDGKWIDIKQEGAKTINAEELANILPTASGFFFGTTDYDEFYLDDIDNTIEILDNIFKNEDWEEYEYFYRASW